jgi:hypothetical protein
MAGRNPRDPIGGIAMHEPSFAGTDGEPFPRTGQGLAALSARPACVAVGPSGTAR